MKVINDGEKMTIECSFAEATHITQALKQYDDLGRDMAKKMQNETIIEPVRAEASK